MRSAASRVVARVVTAIRDDDAIRMMMLMRTLSSTSMEPLVVAVEVVVADSAVTCFCWYSVNDAERVAQFVVVAKRSLAWRHQQRQRQRHHWNDAQSLFAVVVPEHDVVEWTAPRRQTPRRLCLPSDCAFSRPFSINSSESFTAWSEFRECVSAFRAFQQRVELPLPNLIQRKVAQLCFCSLFLFLSLSREQCQRMKNAKRSV